MRSFTSPRAAVAFASLASLAFVLSACSDSTLEPGRRLSAGNADLALIPTPSTIIPGTDNGSFLNTVNANESGRATTEFWDNVSSDNAGASKCNIGFYASANVGTACLLEAPGSNTNANTVYTNFWGDAGGPGGAGNDPSSFMFNGTGFTYDVTLVGSYAGEGREIGWFTKTSANPAVYTFHPVTQWTSKSINFTITVPEGSNWGFYVNTLTAETGGCGGALHPNYACSDATGGFTTTQPQHFALFTSTGNSFLVGTEDNILLLLGEGGADATFHDSDYNDYIFRVTPTATAGPSCTYTKGWYRNNGSGTVTDVDSRTKAQAQTIFGATPGKPNGVTWTGSNDVLNLYQQFLAAILNGGTTGPQAVQDAIAMVAAHESGTGLAIVTNLTQAQVSSLITTLSNFNEGSLPGFPHCPD